MNGDERDASLRPNQIFAVSLPHSMLSAERAREVVNVVRRRLLTPAGLRTLASDDPQYRPHYEGGVWQRDSAYHQGTVWPWLIGPFVEAYLRVDTSDQAREQATEWLRAFEPQLWAYGLGQLPEITDAEPPHAARGCVAQAWSVASILWVLTRLSRRGGN